MLGPSGSGKTLLCSETLALVDFQRNATSSICRIAPFHLVQACQIFSHFVNDLRELNQLDRADLCISRVTSWLASSSLKPPRLKRVKFTVTVLLLEKECYHSHGFLQAPTSHSCVLYNHCMAFALNSKKRRNKNRRTIQRNWAVTPSNNQQSRSWKRSSKSPFFRIDHNDGDWQG